MLGAVEWADLLARARAADDDAPFRQPAEIKRMERLAEFEHDVIGGVHDVVDRRLPQRFEAPP